MSYEIVNMFPHPLVLEETDGTCISLYQPVHHLIPEREQNSIRYKNQLQKIEQSLDKKYDTKEIKRRMQPFYDIGEDEEIWQNKGEGLVIFASDEQCIVYNIERPVKEFVVVADSFHIKPLIRIFQSADRYHLLGLNRDEFTLFEGTRYHIKKVDLHPGVANTAKEILGDEYDDKMVVPGGKGPTEQSMSHGFGSKKDTVHKLTEKFFRVVDSEVYEHYSKPMQLPVYLVALDEYHTLFQNISKNQYLCEQGIKKDYQALEINDLKEAAWEVLEPIYLEKTKHLVDQFETARAQDKGSDDIAQVARAATEGRIERILIDVDKIYPGKVDMETGTLHEANLEHPEIDDVLDDIAEMVFSQSGEVVVVPSERIPSDTGIAAIYRY